MCAHGRVAVRRHDASVHHATIELASTSAAGRVSTTLLPSDSPSLTPTANLSPTVFTLPSASAIVIAATATVTVTVCGKRPVV